MIKKYGDPLPIKGMMESDGQEQVCLVCHSPMVVIAFDDQGTAEIMCMCEKELLDG